MESCLGSCGWGLAQQALRRWYLLEWMPLLWIASFIWHLCSVSMLLHANESSKHLLGRSAFPSFWLINLEKLIVAHFAVCANANEALFELVCDWNRQSPFDVLIFHTLLILLFQKLFDLQSLWLLPSWTQSLCCKCFHGATAIYKGLCIGCSW